MGGTCSTGREEGEVGKRNAGDNVGDINMDKGVMLKMTRTEIRTEIRFVYGISSVPYLVWARCPQYSGGRPSAFVSHCTIKRLAFQQAQNCETSSCGIDAGMQIRGAATCSCLIPRRRVCGWDEGIVACRANTCLERP
jgi:hypothetical protein